MISKKYIAVVAKKGQNQWLKRTSNVKNFISILNTVFKKQKSLRILDAGCANGKDSNEIAKKGFDVEGIDYNKEFIKDAKQKYPDLKFELGDITRLKYKNSTFDAVYCVNTLFYTNPSKSIPQLLRVLKKGGVLFVTLDEKIIDLDKNKIIHSLDMDKTMKLFSKCLLLNENYFERVDKIPFVHKHFFYEIAFRK